VLMTRGRRVAALGALGIALALAAGPVLAATPGAIPTPRPTARPTARPTPPPPPACGLGYHQVTVVVSVGIHGTAPITTLECVPTAMSTTTTSSGQTCPQQGIWIVGPIICALAGPVHLFADLGQAAAGNPSPLLIDMGHFVAGIVFIPITSLQGTHLGGVIEQQAMQPFYMDLTYLAAAVLAVAAMTKFLREMTDRRGGHTTMGTLSSVMMRVVFCIVLIMVGFPVLPRLSVYPIWLGPVSRARCRARRDLSPSR